MGRILVLRKPLLVTDCAVVWVLIIGDRTNLNISRRPPSADSHKLIIYSTLREKKRLKLSAGRRLRLKKARKRWLNRRESKKIHFYDNWFSYFP